MLTSLQRKLNEQRVNAAHERENAALERDVVARMQNQLTTQI